jgi:hypothetical protein
MKRVSVFTFFSIICVGAFAQTAVLPQGKATENLLQHTSQVIAVPLSFASDTDIEKKVADYCELHLPELSFSESSVKLETVRASNLGKHYTFVQTWKGTPVIGGEVKVNVSVEGNIISFINGLWPIKDVPVHENAAIWVYEQGTLLPGRIAQESDLRKVYHAENGALLLCESLNKYFMPGDSTVQAKVFLPDPLTTAQMAYGSPYIDSNDADVTVLNNERKDVSMKVWFDGVKFSLVNKYFKMMEFSSPDIDPVTSSVPEFFYTRSQPGFEDVNAFYHLNVYHKHLDSLGFLNLINDTVLVDAHALGTADQSMFSRYNGRPALFLGEGGVDDGEDADVIVHEYTHSIIEKTTDTDNLTKERQAIDEAVCDYMAIAHSKRFTPYNWRKIFNWDGNNAAIQWTGRSAGTTKTYPFNNAKDFYWNSEIFSATMADLDDLLGSPLTERLLISSLSMMARSSTMKDMCRFMLDTDSMLYGKQHWFPIQQAFMGRNIIDQMVGVKRQAEPVIGFEILNSAGFASGTGQLHITNKNNGIMKVEVYNLTGKRVSNSTVSNQLILFPENYESGIYLIRISSDIQVFTARVVRQ